MLFAAGFGTRMGALTADRPKPLIPVAGKPLIDHALDLIEAHGDIRCVVNLHYKPEMLMSHLAQREVRFSFEAPDILETGGGLRHAMPLLGPGPVFTMNTDAVWRGPNPLSELAQKWDTDEMDALLLCIPPQNARGHQGAGDFQTDADGRAARGPGMIYSGVQIIRTEGLDAIDEVRFSLNLLWDRLLERGRLFVCPYPGLWCDVGHPDGIEIAETMLSADDV